MKKILFILFVIGCIANSNAQVPSYVPTNGLVAYYPFNGNANDESGNGNNLINNNVTFDNDRFENQLSSAYFSGNGSELFLENSINQLLTQDPNQTFSFWFKSVTPNNRYIFEYGSQSSHRYRFVTSPNNAIGIRGENEECTGGGTDNEAPELHSGWHHFVVSINSSNYTVYYDGEVLFSKAHSGFNCVDSINKLNIGNDINGGAKEYTNMIMDDIGIWDRALTEQEVANLYTSNNTSSDTDFLTFSLDDEIEESNINLDEHTIDLKVYSNINITSLIPSFTVSDGAIVKVDDELQESDVTSNDFTDSVIYNVISEDGTNEQNWVVSVKNNNLPIATPDNFTFEEDSGLHSLKVLENDTDADGDDLIITDISNVSGYFFKQLRISDDKKSVEIESSLNYYGELSFNYSISDGYETTESTVSINITPINDDSIVVNDDTLELYLNSNTVVVDVLSNDYDPDNQYGDTEDEFELLYVVSSEQSEVSINEDDNTINYKPKENFYGIDEVTYILSDGTDSFAGKLTVTIINESDLLNRLYEITYTPYSGGTTRHEDFGHKSYDIYSDLLSADMALSVSSYGWYRASITEFNATQDFTDILNRQVWRYYYGIINKSDLLIEKILEGNVAGDDTSVNHTLGQAKSMRAYAYFYLTQFFQDEFEGGDLILPILITNEDFYASFNELSTADEIFNFIEEDLNHAISLLDGFTRNSKTEINKSVAQGLYAYVLGARGTDYSKAYNMAKAAISGHALMSASEITGGFTDVNTPGWMWGVDLTEEIGLGLLSWWGQVDSWSYSYAWAGDYKVIDSDLFAAIPANDARKAQFSDNPASSRHLQPLFKFYASNQIGGTSSTVTADYVYMRVAEMHLLAAEYAAFSGNDAQARTELKALVSQRVPDASYIDGLSGQALKDEIYLQTRIELWGEGKSYLAMKRNKATVTRGSNHLSFVGEPIRHNDDRLTFEIPQGFGFTPNDPKVYLIGVDQYTINLGETFNDPGAFAVDSEDNDISENITITGSIDNNTEGEYTLVYSVRDSLGHRAIPKFRKVIVENNALGLADSKKDEFSIYPNPSKEIINIRSKKELQSVEIYSILGEKVMFFEKKIQQLNIKNLSKGIYIMKLITNQGSAFKKFVKN